MLNQQEIFAKILNLRMACGVTHTHSVGHFLHAEATFPVNNLSWIHSNFNYGFVHVQAELRRTEEELYAVHLYIKTVEGNGATAFFPHTADFDTAERYYNGCIEFMERVRDEMVWPSFEDALKTFQTLGGHIDLL